MGLNAANYKGWSLLRKDSKFKTINMSILLAELFPKPAQKVKLENMKSS